MHPPFRVSPCKTECRLCLILGVITILPLFFGLLRPPPAKRVVGDNKVIALGHEPEILIGIFISLHYGLPMCPCFHGGFNSFKASMIDQKKRKKWGDLTCYDFLYSAYSKNSQDCHSVFGLSYLRTWTQTDITLRIFSAIA